MQFQTCFFSYYIILRCVRKIPDYKIIIILSEARDLSYTDLYIYVNLAPQLYPIICKNISF